MLNFFIGFTTGVVVTSIFAAFLAVFAAYIRRKARQEQERKNELARLRYASNPQLPLRSQARYIVRSAINLEKKFRCECGYSVQQLIACLVTRFDAGMDFNNYGEVWEIDHVKPLKMFDLTDMTQFKQAIHPSNIQPLFRGENQSKGCK